MSLEVKEVTTEKQYREFVQLPFELYKDNQYWVPPIKKDELKALKPASNPAFQFCRVKFWLAYRNNRCVGRIAGIIHDKYNELKGTSIARFSRMEFEDSAETAGALLEVAENWARENGMNAIHGPLGFSNLDHQAMLVEGFDHLPSIASEYHLPYYHKHLESFGYKKEIDWVEFRLKLGDAVPEKALKLNSIIQKRYGLKVVSFTNTAQMRPYGKKIFALLNEAFKDLFSMVPLDDQMIEYYINRYFNLLNPEFVKVVLSKEEEIVGFIVGLPSLSQAMQKAGGKLFPFGFVHIMKALKKPKVVDLLLTGIDPKMQGQGVSALLITELQQVMIKYGVTHVETTGIIETNQKAIQHWKNYDHVQHKRKRCYRKDF